MWQHPKQPKWNSVPSVTLPIKSQIPNQTTSKFWLKETSLMLIMLFFPYWCNWLSYAHKLPLGLVIIGETCLGKQQPPTSLCLYKTFILDNGCSTHFVPCKILSSVNTKSEPLLGKTSSDETSGLLIKDKRLIEVMESNDSGGWTAPLPFRSNRPPLPNNRKQELNGAKSFHLSIKQDPDKEHHTSFM